MLLKNFPIDAVEDVLMHEMIHVALIVDGVIETTGGDKIHGKEFQDMLTKLEKPWGRMIPQKKTNDIWLKKYDE